MIIYLHGFFSRFLHSCTEANRAGSDVTFKFYNKVIDRSESDHSSVTINTDDAGQQTGGTIRGRETNLHDNQRSSGSVPSVSLS